ncbi:MAG: cation:proton antiporter [Spirochaetaceae bacterium]|nr:cation:proton antiporter [Spirochaetaceae bacterium]|tara:strand:- start:450844 stop:451185 length:342 start_codon:yes stop_codon:yes gene_type:complete
MIDLPWKEIQFFATIILISGGIFFMLVGSVGIIRLPDFFSRTHAVSKSDTLGVFLAIIGMIVYEGFTLSSGKLALIVLFIALANPIGTHALGRAAFRKGVMPVLTGNRGKKGK